jgi:hypothetical protein
MRIADRGSARGRGLVVGLCRELENARIDRGLSYAALGRTLGLSASQVGRICRGQSPRVSVLRLAQLFTLVGLDLSARAFPGGQPLRDSGHLALIARFRVHVDPKLSWRTEVPVVPFSFDRPELRAWDATVGSHNWTIGIEAETHVHDVQALLRRLALKQRDGDVVNVILLLGDTKHHRNLLSSAGAELSGAFPVGSREALWSLRRGIPPRANALVLV